MMLDSILRRTALKLDYSLSNYYKRSHFSKIAIVVIREQEMYTPIFHIEVMHWQSQFCNFTDYLCYCYALFIWYKPVLYYYFF